MTEEYKVPMREVPLGAPIEGGLGRAAVEQTHMPEGDEPGAPAGSSREAAAEEAKEADEMRKAAAEDTAARLRGVPPEEMPATDPNKPAAAPTAPPPAA